MIHFSQRVGFLTLLFVSLFISTNAEAFSFKDIIFSPATAEFLVENTVAKSASNHVKLTTQIVDENSSTIPEVPEVPTLSFYRYDSTADTYLSIEHTDFSPSEALIGSFNPMTPLLLEDGQEIDITKKIPAIKCLLFKRKEPLIVMYHDSNLSHKKRIKLLIKTDKDKEIIRLKHTDENASMFVGYINTTLKRAKKCDGKLYVEAGTQIEASLWQKKSKRHKKSKKSRTQNTAPVFAMARIGSDVLEVKASREVQKDALWVGVKASKDIASMGEFIAYTYEIENRSDKAVTAANFTSILSSGLHYVKNTFYIDDKKVKAKNLSWQGKELMLRFDMQAAEHKTLRFVSQVDISAKKNVKSRGFILYNNQKSNIATAQTKLEKDFDDRAVIMGNIVLDTDEKNVSLAGVRIYLDNGMYTHSDRFGKFHFGEVSLAKHVVSVDPQSISGRFVLKECRNTARTMGSKTSVFVDTRLTHIQDAKFCVAPDKQTEKLKPSLSFKIDQKPNDIMPAYRTKSFETWSKKASFIWPKEGYVPAMPSTKIAFLHPSSKKVELTLNGKKVDMLNYDGFAKSADKKWTLSKYRGIDIVDGDNIFEMHILGTKKRITRTVHLSMAPIKAKVLPDKSTLLADGKTNPVIAVQLFDKAGYPLRRGMVGTFSVQKPYVSQARLDFLQDNPLSNHSGQDQYTVSEDGIAFIPLHATTTSGEVKLHFPFQQKNEYTKAWLSSAPREWFVVGFAEGTMGYETLKTHLTNQATESSLLEGEMSFFAKGKVGADALLSIAYDSGKRSDLGIVEEIDPKSEYTVFEDESTQRNEAPSSKKLYVKIERKTFYALFGDFDTGLDTHELSRYTRRINGLKSGFKGDVLEYSAFVSQNRSHFVREELNGDGTSGLYHLKSKDIMIGSERVHLEVRDRYRSEIVLSTMPMTSLLDYNIDYQAGTLYFKEPILRRDRAGNPQVIVVTYEDAKEGENRISFGGRSALKGMDAKAEVGVTLLSEETDDDFDTLYGFDARIQASDTVTINAEYAQSKTHEDNNTTAAKAYLAEVTYHDRYSESRLYYAYQEAGFGFGQQSMTQSGTRKYGLDSSINYWQNVAIKLALYGDEVLASGEMKHVAEAIVQYDKRRTSGLLGYRYTSIDAEGGHSQLISAISKRFFKNKVKLSAAYELTLGEKSDKVLNRMFAQASYFVNQYVEIFANHEILEGKTITSQQSRAGVKGGLWSGGTLESAISNERGDEASRLFGLLGVNQNWNVSKNMALNLSYEQEHTIESQTEVEDFTAYAASVNYHKKFYNTTLRAEYRTSQTEVKTNLDFGVYTEVNQDIGMALGMRGNRVATDSEKSDHASAKFSLAYRPEPDFMVLNRLEYLYDKTDSHTVAKAIERLLLVAHPSQKSTFSGHYALKHVQDTIAEEGFSSWIDTVGAAYIYDVTKRLELGFQGGFLHAYESHSLEKSLGLYLGYNLFANTYVGLGYNALGFEDGDFSQMQQTKQGAYVTFRVKFDQESLEQALKFF